MINDCRLHTGLPTKDEDLKLLLSDELAKIETGGYQEENENHVLWVTLYYIYVMFV